MKQPELSLKALSGCPCFALFCPDKLLYDGDLLQFGSVKIHVIETPGHSDGTVSLFFHIREGEKSYRCGLMGGIGLNTRNHTNQNFTLEKQAKRKEGLLEGRNSFVDSQEWKRFLDGAKVRYWEMVKKRK